MTLLKTSLLTTTDLWFKEYSVVLQLNGTSENAAPGDMSCNLI
jgi:hypothetical protein